MENNTTSPQCRAVDMKADAADAADAGTHAKEAGIQIDTGDMQDNETMVEAVADELVRIKFEDYKARRCAQGQTVEYERIEDQPETLRRSNYEQITHMLAKAASLGYVVIPVGRCDPALRIEAFSDKEIETLAALEHERWVAERIADGWTSGLRDHAKKTTPYLIPYGQLPEEIKDYDRDVAKSVIPLLGKAGLAVSVRSGDAAACGQAASLVEVPAPAGRSSDTSF